MKTFEFKKLEIREEGSWLQRQLRSAHVRKTALFAVIGAAVGYIMFFASHNMDSHLLWSDEAFKNVMMGAAFGVFITNSPCARGKC
ncbi:MAG: hypothetical protein RIS47_1136 [Bacteroidota bacterium]|jgi:hypothetical protein